MILRPFLFLILLIVAVTAPTWLLGICAFAYALRYTAYELIVLAAAIDAYYGLGLMQLPYYTLATVVTLFIVEWVKPFISVYNEAK